VYNATNSAWEEVQAVGDFFINTLSSSSGTGGGSATFNGSAYRFTLSNAPTNAQQLLVSINGVVQKPNSGTSQPSEGFAIDGGDIILAAAPATGADAFFITIGSSVGIGTPSDNTISTAKIIDDAVTSAKIATLDANLQFADSVEAQFGAGNDLRIYHDGSHSRIVDAGTGNLIAQASRFSVHSADDSETMIDAVADSHVKLYHNGNEKLATKSDGIDVTGEVQCDSLDVDGSSNFSGNLNLDDNVKLRCGTHGDLDIYHDGTDSYLSNVTGDLILRTVSPGDDVIFRAHDDVIIQSGGSDNAIICNNDGDVELYFNTSKKLETKSDGVDIIGELQCDSLDVDGAADITGVLSSSEEIRVDRSGATNLCFTAKQSGTTNASIKADGSVSFATGNFQVNDDGAILVDRNAATKAILNGYQSSSLTSHILAGGSAYFAGDVTIGTTTVPTGLVLGKSLTAASSTGAEVVAFRSDTSVAVGDKCGAFVIGNSDTDGAEDHFVGMWGKVASTNGSMDLHFAAGRASYEGDTPDVTIKSGGNVGIGISSPTSQSGKTLHLHNSGGQQRLHLTTNNTGSAAGDGLDIILEHNTDGDVHILNHETNGDLKLGAGDAERVRILSSGGMTFNGDTATANALNDYEEGTWTPSILRAGSNPSVTYSYRSGKYTKIGNQVFIYFDLSMTALSGGSGCHEIHGLPFATATDNLDGGYGSPQFRNSTAFGNATAQSNPSAYHGTTTISLRYHSSVSSEDCIPLTTGRITGWSVYFTDS
jgi:hypothetical protein